MRPGDGLGHVLRGVDSEVSEAAIVFLSYVDDGVSELMSTPDVTDPTTVTERRWTDSPQDERSVGQGRSDHTRTGQPFSDIYG